MCCGLLRLPLTIRFEPAIQSLWLAFDVLDQGTSPGSLRERPGFRGESGQWERHGSIQCKRKNEPDQRIRLAGPLTLQVSNSAHCDGLRLIPALV